MTIKSFVQELDEEDDAEMPQSSNRAMVEKEKDKPKKEQAEEPKKNWLVRLWNRSYPNLLLVWDGLGFFGFDDTKLDRLKAKNKDKPASFLSKFTSIRWILLSLSSFVAVIVILILEGGKLNTLKSKQINLDQQIEYTYPIQDVLTLVFANWFWLD